MSLRVILPFDIKPAMLVTSAVAESHAAWSMLTSYTVGQRCINPATNMIFECVQAHSNKPLPAKKSEYWLRVGATNPWRMFDTKQLTTTSKAGGFYVELTLGKAATGLSLQEVTADSVRVIVTDPVAGVVKDDTYQMLSRPLASGWWQFFYGRREAASELLLLDLPAYPAATIRLEFEGANAAVGACVIGQLLQVGVGVEWGIKVTGQDHSQKKVDAWGEVELIPGLVSPGMQLRVVLEPHEEVWFRRLMYRMAGRTAVWIGTRHRAITTIHGWVEDWEFDLSNPKRTLFIGDLKGLT